MAGDAGAGSSGVVGIVNADVLVVAEAVVTLACVLVAGLVEDRGAGGEVVGVDEAEVAEVAGRSLDNGTGFTAEVAANADVGLAHIGVGDGNRIGCGRRTGIHLSDRTRVTQCTGLGVAVAAPAVEKFLLVGD